MVDIYLSIPWDILYGEDSNAISVILELSRITGIALNTFSTVVYSFAIRGGIKPTAEKPCKENRSME